MSKSNGVIKVVPIAFPIEHRRGSRKTYVPVIKLKDFMELAQLFNRKAVFRYTTKDGMTEIYHFETRDYFIQCVVSLNETNEKEKLQQTAVRVV